MLARLSIKFQYAFNPYDFHVLIFPLLKPDISAKKCNAIRFEELNSRYYIMTVTVENNVLLIFDFEKEAVFNEKMLIMY